MDILALKQGAEAPERANAQTLHQAAQDLADAFVEDPHVSWFVRNDSGRDLWRLRFFEFVLGEFALPQGEVHKPACGGAAAVWLPSEALQRVSLVQELLTLPVMLRVTGWRRIGRLMALSLAMDKHHPMDRPHTYLWFLGVTPAVQGHGIGSRLLRAGLDPLDREGRAAFLETSSERNVALYRRHGFKVVADYKPTPTGPQTYGMWRDPGVTEV